MLRRSKPEWPSCTFGTAWPSYRSVSDGPILGSRTTAETGDLSSSAASSPRSNVKRDKRTYPNIAIFEMIIVSGSWFWPNLLFNRNFFGKPCILKDFLSKQGYPLSPVYRPAPARAINRPVTEHLACGARSPRSQPGACTSTRLAAVSAERPSMSARGVFCTDLAHLGFGIRGQTVSHSRRRGLRRHATECVKSKGDWAKPNRAAVGLCAAAR